MADNLPFQDEPGGTCKEDEKVALSCYVCKEAYSKENMPILLSCLHTICDNCTKNQQYQAEDMSADIIEKDVIECPSCKTKTQSEEILLNYLIVHTFTTKSGDVIECPSCKTKTQSEEILLNYLIVHTFTTKSGGESSTDDPANICTACEENETAVNYCTNCCEWLCEVCTQAHKRVRVTKDHEIVSQGAVEKAADVSAKELMKCSLHPQEDLKLFCETCDKLTCRDCQLQEHREHKHHFVTEAIEQTKRMLASLRAALKKKSHDLFQFKTRTDQQLENAIDQEKQIAENVNQIFSTMKREIDKKEHQILSDLHQIWSKQTDKIKQSNNDCINLSVVINHCTEFVDTILNNRSNLFALYTKASILKHAQKILSKQIAPCPDPIDVRYKHNIKVMLQNMNYLGHLAKNGVIVGQPANAAVSQQPLNQPAGPESSRQILMRMLKHLPVEQHKHFIDALRASSDHSQSSSGSNQQHGPPNKVVPANMVVNHGRPPMYGPSLGHKLANQMRQSGQTPVNSLSHLTQLRTEVQKQQQAPAGFSEIQNRIRLEQQTRLQMAQKYQQSVIANRPMGSPHSLGLNQPTMVVQQNLTQQGLSQGHSQGLSHQTLTQGLAQLAQGLRPATLRPSPPTPIIDQKPIIPSWTVPADNVAKLPETSPVLMRRLSGTGSEPSPTRSPQSNPSCEGTGSRPSSRDSGIAVKQETSQNGSTCGYRATPNIDAFKDKDLMIHQMSFLDHEHAREDMSEASNVQHALNKVDQDNLEAAIFSVPIMSDGSSFQPCQPTEEPAADRSGTSTPPATLPEFQPGLLNSPQYGPITNQDPGDPSEDYCACCHNGGDLLCCDRCPKVFHLTCHIPQLDTTPQGCWTCLLCEPVETLSDEPEPEKEGADGNKRKAPSGLNDAQMKLCERILLELYCHESSMPFHLPVSKTIVPDYYKVITHPMDFSKIKSKLTRQHFNRYTSIEDFLSDVLLVFSNCLWYNGVESEVGATGVILNEFSVSLVVDLLPEYSDYMPMATITGPLPATDTDTDSPEPETKRPREDSQETDSEVSTAE